ncbi:hypothetical protein GGI03_007939, partial [Coemansia sp. RSA 2337]
MSSHEHRASKSVAGSSVVSSNSSDSTSSHRRSGNEHEAEAIFTPTIVQEEEEEEENDAVHTPRLTRSTDAIATTEPVVRQAVASMPNIKIRLYPELKARRIYADLYADSYSDSDISEDDVDPGHSPVEAVVMGFERGAAKLPAVRVGAARLGEM